MLLPLSMQHIVQNISKAILVFQPDSFLQVEVGQHRHLKSVQPHRCAKAEKLPHPDMLSFGV